MRKDRLGDISAFEKDELRAVYEEKYGSTNPGSITKVVNMLWNFYHQIREGDTVLARKGTKKLAARGCRMDRLATYQELVKELLTHHAERMQRHPQPGVEVELTFDEERDHYILLRIGWTAKGRLFVPTLYARLRDGKVWIENDWTEDGLATELLEQGVPPEDVVLAFHPPEMRVHTKFAAA